ncbi:hypothetical protein AGMMS49991_11340 [Spirochaetia bacterium]|nr:hypothetical protein AGMMS49991_11340 [Spirochaetia bacterium]
MSIKMKKSGLIIAFSLIALMLAGVLAALAGCMPAVTGFSITAPVTGVDTNDTTGGSDHGLPTTTRIEIYWDNNENANQAGKELTWLYNNFATLHPASSRRIGGKIFNAPAGFDYLEWTIEPSSAVTAGIVSIPIVFDNSLNKVLPNGSSFEISAGAVPGNARISVQNMNSNGVRGTFYASMDIRVGGGGGRQLIRPIL